MSDRRQQLQEFGREGGVNSGVVRRERILERVAQLPIHERVLEAYRQGYDAGYHTAQKRSRRGVTR